MSAPERILAWEGGYADDGCEDGPRWAEKTGPYFPMSDADYETAYVRADLYNEAVEALKAVHCMCGPNDIGMGLDAEIAAILAKAQAPRDTAQEGET